MKVMFDIDPKSLKKLESIAAAKQMSIGEMSAELLLRILNREPGQGPANASSSGLHPVQGVGSSSGLQPIQGGSGSRPAVPPPAGINENMLIMLLEPLIARFRLADADGSQRKAVVAELSMMLPDPLAAKLIALIKRSLE